MVTLGGPLVHVGTLFFLSLSLSLLHSSSRSHASVCTVKTAPCASTHPHMSDICTCCRYTRRRDESAHGGFQRATPRTYRRHYTTTHTRPSPPFHQHTATQHNTAQHNTTQNTPYRSEEERRREGGRWEMQDGR